MFTFFKPNATRFVITAKHVTYAMPSAKHVHKSYMWPLLSLYYHTCGRLFPRLQGLWENVRPFISCLHFFKWRYSLRTLVPFVLPGSVHSGSESWDDCGWMFPEKLHISLFLDRFSYYARTAAQSAHYNFVRSTSSRMYACLGVTCHLHFWQNDRDLLHATAVTRVCNRHWIKVSTQS